MSIKDDIQSLERELMKASNGRIRMDGRLEEAKVLEYLKNLLGSALAVHKPKELFGFAASILGQEKLVYGLKKVHPQYNNNEAFNKWVEDEDLDRKVPQAKLSKFLTSWVLEHAVKIHKKYCIPSRDETLKRLRKLQDMFRLTDAEAEIVLFFYIYDANDVLQQYCGDRREIGDLTLVAVFRRHGDKVLNASDFDIRKALMGRKLFDAEILERNRSQFISISDWCADYLSGVGSDKLQDYFFTIESTSKLHIKEFDFPEERLKTLRRLLTSKGPANILLYGEPGSGKSSFAKALISSLGKECIEVAIPNDDNINSRKCSIYATLNISDKDKSVILVDEADELLNETGFLFAEAKTTKSWINGILDRHGQKMIWITNRTRGMNTSTMRRFHFAVEFKRFTPGMRLSILKKELRKLKLSNYFTGEELEDICETYPVNADGIANVIKLLETGDKSDKEEIKKYVETVLEGKVKAQGGRISRSSRKRFDHYSVEYLNTSGDIKELIRTARNFAALKKSEGLDSSKPLTMLFHGQPGTGKTEFAHYLGHALGKSVLLRRSSDILSPYVGEAEMNIAQAFEDARREDKILLFDEADSFLFPRKDAIRSWEKQLTNEILTQLETHTGIVVFSTNELTGLDHAALRRFRFKIEFKPLSHGGALKMFGLLIRQLGLKERHIKNREKKRLASLQNLTPGDFAVVRDNFSYLEPAEMSENDLIDALENEVKYKNGTRRVIGF
jgi:transitional endoplasmic reticulum ATPase